jgi:hypothetical protein
MQAVIRYAFFNLAYWRGNNPEIMWVYQTPVHISGKFVKTPNTEFQNARAPFFALGLTYWYYQEYCCQRNSSMLSFLHAVICIISLEKLLCMLRTNSMEEETLLIGQKVKRFFAFH